MRRWLTRILICLFLGGVTTIGVAWGLALTMPTLDEPASSVTPISTERPRWAIGAFTDPGASDIIAISIGDLDWPSGIDETRLPGWSRAADLPPADEVEGVTFFFEWARGWPMLSLYWRETYPPTRRRESRFEVELARRIPMYPDARFIPRAAIFPGFLIDTLFYGMLWFGLFFGFRAARRGLRKRRGLCPICAYDLRGGLPQAGRLCHRIQGCPECGWNRSDDQPPSEAGG